MQKYDAGKTKYFLQKEANRMKQKYVTQETAAQNIENDLQSSPENEKIEEFKGNHCMENSTGPLQTVS